jgi:hypothetical protein
MFSPDKLVEKFSQGHSNLIYLHQEQKRKTMLKSREPLLPSH